MKKIEIKFKNNGYEVVYEGFSKGNGELVYKFTEELKMVAEIGQALLEKKLDVKER